MLNREFIKAGGKKDERHNRRYQNVKVATLNDKKKK